LNFLFYNRFLMSSFFLFFYSRKKLL